MITNKQKAFLRALGNHQRAVFQVGKEGITDNLITGISDGLNANEILKFKLLKTCPLAANEAAIMVAAATQSEIVQIIGKTVLLYKKNPDGKIKLPR